MNIPTDKPVMITGATGYVAGWIIKELLDHGLTVHAAVRDPSKTEKLKSLDELAKNLPGSIRYFKGDLLDDGSYAEAMEGCELVFHTASPFTMNVEDPQKDLVDPAQLGTRNVLEQANRTETVKRVVVTSSCAAIYGDNADLENAKGPRFSEEDWNDSSSLKHQAYSFSKVTAEREAWRIADLQDRWKLVCINPSLILGPAIDEAASGESISIMTQFGDGTMKSGVPDFRIGLVDVRDVAEAHVKAGFLPGAEGRYLTSGHNSGFPEIAEILRREFGGDYAFPKRTLPKWLVWLFGPMINKRLTRKMVSLNVGRPWFADNSKSIEQLGLTYRPMKESVIGMFQQLVVDAERVEKVR